MNTLYGRKESILNSSSVYNKNMPFVARPSVVCRLLVETHIKETIEPVAFYPVLEKSNIFSLTSITKGRSEQAFLTLLTDILFFHQINVVLTLKMTMFRRRIQYPVRINWYPLGFSRL